MKTLIITLAIGLLIQQKGQAQGTIYLSNLGQTSTGSSPVGNDSWIASEIMTGANAGGYALDSIQLEMADASGNPTGFTAAIYSETGVSGFVPGTSLCVLNGSIDPSNSGIYTYTSAPSIMLSPSTIYFIVLTAGTAIGNGAYEWNLTGPNLYNPIDGWRAGGIWDSSDGSHWSYHSGSPQFALGATPVPEPGVLGLFVLGSLFFIGHRRSAKVA